MSSSVQTSLSEQVGEIRSLGAGARVKLLGIRALNYLTNYVVNRIPSYTLRHLWYRRILGVQLGEGAGILLGCYIWFYGPGQMRRNGLRIGDNCRINRNCCLDARDALTIGNNVSISPDVTILTTQHLHDDPGLTRVPSAWCLSTDDLSRGGRFRSARPAAPFSFGANALARRGTDDGLRLAANSCS